ncbi:hypothetical protein GGR02_001406 [Anoxybacillus voinovskiensis]|uniref:Uncharacterized protein n=1 Tax=Anoxybacteroides voinovskiense TaxID=230470 RepID=A0A840DKQ2_9BACL|nr:hypothetical protein [Anoxybacillus voinovskiensis]MBB4073644.1 hypothetical protein [Anoxybacillus voinovskiensis]GGJ63418.1 hypothetical protein GCM10008982_10810 [Anoxybacillus voinovskiensis]
MYSLLFAASPKEILATYLVLMASCLVAFPVTMFLVETVKGVKRRW